MFLLDTHVISELRRTAKTDRTLASRANAHSAAGFVLPAIPIIDTDLGALLIARKDPAQGVHLRAEIDRQILAWFDRRVQPVDPAVAQHCARRHGPAPRAEGP